MSETKLCKDCKHYGEGVGANTDKCHVNCGDFLRISFISCLCMRRDGECGVSGKLFKSMEEHKKELLERKQADAAILALIRGGTDGQD